MRPRSLLLGVALALAPARLALAHDFWVEPSAWRPAVGSVLHASLRIGHPGAPEPYARNPSHVAWMALCGDAGSRDLAGLPGADPAGSARVEEEGRYVVAYRSTASTVELEPAKFEAYLVEKGLERVVRERLERGEAELPGREAYVRCAKALVRTPKADPGPWDRAVGLPLELVLAGDPAAAVAQAQPVRVRLDFEGRPLEGALVQAQPLHPAPDAPDAPIEPLDAFTDARGEAALALDGPGPWLVTAVHMVRAEQGSPQQWRSWWASSTFELSR